MKYIVRLTKIRNGKTIDDTFNSKEEALEALEQKREYPLVKEGKQTVEIIEENTSSFKPSFPGEREEITRGDVIYNQNLREELGL